MTDPPLPNLHGDDPWRASGDAEVRRGSWTAPQLRGALDMNAIGGMVQLRFQIVADGRVLVNELVSVEEVDTAAVRHGDVARAAIEAGHKVRLIVSDPDDDDRVVFVSEHEAE